MAVLTAPLPIPGEPLDPPPKETPELLRRLDETDNRAVATAGVLVRAARRLIFSRATLLAAGTTYYVFLGLFSLIALGYGVAALFGADSIADYLTEALTELFPSLLGDDGIDPDQLRSVGQTASLVGLLSMLYSGSGAMVAASSSIHQIYGARPDPRNYVIKRLRLGGWLLVIGPLVVASLVSGFAVLNFSSQVMRRLGLDGTRDRVLVHVAATVITLAIDALVVYLLLGRLGGIRPARRPLIVGSLVGAFVLQLLRLPMGLIIKVSADKPQYGALALPISVLIVLYLYSLVLFGAAALTAAMAERDPSADESPTAAEPDGADSGEAPEDPPESDGAPALDD